MAVSLDSTNAAAVVLQGQQEQDKARSPSHPHLAKSEPTSPSVWTKASASRFDTSGLRAELDQLLEDKGCKEQGIIFTPEVVDALQAYAGLPT